MKRFGDAEHPESHHATELQPQDLQVLFKIFMCEHVHSCVGTCMCAQMWRPKVDTSSLS